ncbi:MAG: hypothetical protein RLZZ488_461 [Pseudomonadota bacterium]|jgi:hypothetical protein
MLTHQTRHMSRALAALTLFLMVACKKNQPEVSEAQGNGPLSNYASKIARATFQIRDGGFGPRCDLSTTDARGLPLNCKSFPVCTGTLVNDSRLHNLPVGISAAHCSADGENIFAFFPAQKKSIRVGKFFPHPKFSSSRFWFHEHLSHLIGNAPRTENAMNFDIALLKFETQDTRGLESVAIRKSLPKLPDLASPAREKQYTDLRNMRQGIVQTHLVMSLQTYDPFPKITVLGFGVDSLVWNSQIRRTNYPKEICEAFSQNSGSRVRYIWNETLGCTVLSESDAVVKGPGPDGYLRENSGRLAALSAELATAVFVPPSAQPKNSPCLGDSGGPLVLSGESDIVAVVNGGPGLCAGTISSYTLIIPHLNELKNLLR